MIEVLMYESKILGLCSVEFRFVVSDSETELLVRVAFFSCIFQYYF